MKKSQLKQLIKEEIDNILFEQKINKDKVQNMKNFLEKGNKINSAFEKHLDKYIDQYNKTGNVQL